MAFFIFDKETVVHFAVLFKIFTELWLKRQNDPISKKKIASNLFPFSSQCNGFDIKAFLDRPCFQVHLGFKSYRYWELTFGTLKAS